MDERVMQLRIGLMVLATVIIIAILLMIFGGQQDLLQWIQHKPVFYVQFSDAPGVTVNTPVQKSGIRIGRVTEVRLADDVTDMELDDDVGVVVTIEIDRNRRIFADEVCHINRNLLGDAVLEFVRVKDNSDSGRQDKSGRKQQTNPQGNPGGDSRAKGPTKPREVVQPGAKLRGKVQTDPIQVVGNLEQDLSVAFQSIAQTSNEIRDFVEKLNEFLGTEKELESKRQRLENTMIQLEKLAESANDVIGDEQLRQQLKDTVAQFPEVLGEVRSTVGQMSETLNGMQETMGLVNNNLRHIEDFTQPLGEQGPEVIGRLNRGAEKLELLMGELHTFSRALNSREGTVGRLIGDPELYENLNQAVLNIEDLTRQLRPVVRDARIFSDRIARHPELLGVRGALERSSGTKGVPRLSELQGMSGVSQPPSFPRFSQPR